LLDVRLDEAKVFLIAQAMSIQKLRLHVVLAPAEKQPLTTERLSDQLGRLGGTPFKLGSLQNHLEGGVILPVKELNELRRRVAADLEAQRAQPRRWQRAAEFKLPSFAPAPAATDAD
jgi:putative protease